MAFSETYGASFNGGRGGGGGARLRDVATIHDREITVVTFTVGPPLRHL